MEKIAYMGLSAVNPPLKKQLKPEWKINASVLNIFNDHDYNRSVITLVADTEHIGQ